VKSPKNVRGHFRSLWTNGGGILIPTTITTQRKSRVREREMAKRQLVADAIEKLAGTRPAMIARPIDGVIRRWNGIRGCNSDG
jgi:hypothetical protein